MPLHELNPFDEFFLYDKDSPANASMIFRMEKFPFEKYRNFIRNVQCKKLQKHTVKLVQICGRFYWVELSEKEIDEKFDEFVTKADEV